MLGFIIGLFLGAFIGVAVMCLCSVTSKADEDTENYKYAKKTKKMNKSRAIKNSECYYELNMLKLLFKMNLLTEEEYKCVVKIVLKESENILLTA